MSNFISYELSKKSDALKKLILENPNLPIAVLAGEDACTGFHYWTFCSSISFQIAEILDCDFVNDDDAVFDDREKLKDKITDDLYDDFCDGPDDEYEAAIQRKLQELEPHWTKVIAIYATN